MENKVGIITQVRMTSTRLPGKVLKQAGGTPLLKHHADRLKASGLPLIVATTVNASDDPIAEFAAGERLAFFRGSEDDVLSRFYHAARENNLQTVVRVTSDCPLIDGNIIKTAVAAHLEKNDPFLYSSNVMERTFPRGFDFEIFSFARLETAFHQAHEQPFREHVTPYINKNIDGKTRYAHITTSPDFSSWRLTVDTPEDYELIRVLIEKFECHRLNYDQIREVLSRNSELRLINAHIEQKKV